MTGRTFERLLVLRRDDSDPTGKAAWWAQCDCGSPEVSVAGRSLTAGLTKSCGCLRRELTSQRCLIDLTGHQFGRLMVVRRDGSKQRKATWRVQCDCGSPEFSVVGSSLVRGLTESCGCLHRALVSQRLTINLAGRTFGRLKVLRRDGSDQHGDARWLVKCDCGTEFSVVSASLMRGATESCGCLRREVISQLSTTDLTGRTFGRLQVLRRDGSYHGGKNARSIQAKWRVKCDCGSPELSVVGSHLISGHTKSCGCLNREITAARNLKQHLQGTSEDGVLYVIGLTNAKERFLKVGFAEDLDTRFKEYHHLGYNLRTIHAIFGPKPFLLHLEGFIHGRDDSGKRSPFAHWKYRPAKKFGGYTECFKESARLDLCEFLDDCNESDGRL